LSDDTASGYGNPSGQEAAGSLYGSGVGTVEFTDGASYSWIANPLNAAQYEIRVQQTSGDPLEGTSSPLNTWIDLGGGAVWRVFANEFNESVMSFLTAEIRHKTTQQTVATNSFSLLATTSQFPIIP